jgi:hypothetical protein
MALCLKKLYLHPANLSSEHPIKTIYHENIFYNFSFDFAAKCLQ